MTTSATAVPSSILGTRPALTVGEVLGVIPCLVCGAGAECDHTVARMRRAVAIAQALNGPSDAPAIVAPA